MIATFFLVPITDNEGAPFAPSQFREVTKLLLDAFGGFSGPTIVDGMWRGDDGRVYKDRSRRYDVALTSWRQVQNLVEIVDWVCSEFRQEAIFLSVAGVPEIVNAVR